MSSPLIKNVTIVNEGKIFIGDIRIKNGLIEEVGALEASATDVVIDGTGKYLLPGVID